MFSVAEQATTFANKNGRKERRKKRKEKEDERESRRLTCGDLSCPLSNSYLPLLCDAYVWYFGGPKGDLSQDRQALGL